MDLGQTQVACGVSPTPAPRISSAWRRLAGNLLDALVLSFTLGVGWYVWSLVAYRGIRSPGKQLLGMEIVDRCTGGPPGWRRKLLRLVAKWLLLTQLTIPAVLIVRVPAHLARETGLLPRWELRLLATSAVFALQLGWFMATTCWLLWDRNRQQLWDKLAGTIVVDEPRPADGQRAGVVHRSGRRTEEDAMARLRYIDRADLPEDYRYLFDNLSRDGGRVGNLFRVMGHSPGVLHQFLRLGNTLRSHTKIDPKLRELAILTVGRLANAPYEYVHHIAIARRAGVSEEQIDGLPVWERHPAFSEQERAVIRYAEAVTRDIRVSDEVFDAVRAFLDEEQMVELAMNVAYYNLVVRFLEPMQVELEDEQ